MSDDSEDQNEDYDFDLIEENGDFIVAQEDQDRHDAIDSDSEDENFSLTHPNLNRILTFNQERTVKDAVLLQLSLSVRHKLTYECLIQSFESLNFLLGSKHFPTSKKELWRVLGRDEAGIVAYVYCRECGSLIGKKTDLGEQAVCPDCSTATLTSKAPYFVSISLRRQLKFFLSLPEVGELLKYREVRVKKHDGEAMEDIFDSEKYKNIEVDGQKLLNSNNYTYVLNTDGCKIRKGGKLNIYPLFFRINELPPNMRQKFMFLGGLYVDNKEPSMMGFLHPIVLQLNSLATRGIEWRRDGNLVTSKFVVTCFCVDGKANCQMLNMVPWSSHYGCTSCLYYGVTIDRRMRYPQRHELLPACENRTDRGMREDMVQAEAARERTGNVNVRGHKGISSLILLKHLDLGVGSAFDDLHNVYECAVLNHTELLLTEVPRLNGISENIMFATIDSRLSAIKTPSCIARKPGKCKIKNRKQMHGNEWRNFLWYGFAACLFGLVPVDHIRHMERLSYAIYLLSMDIIIEDHTTTAERLILEYLDMYDEKFGIERTRLNIHRLKHAAESVRNWGALWVYSTFNFESWNGKLIQLVTSPKGALQQIVTRHLLHFTLEAALHGMDDIPQDVKDQMRKILHKRRLVNAHQVADHTYVSSRIAVRAPTEGESQVLRSENFGTQELQTYDKLHINGVRYTTSRFTSSKDSLSDDSTIFTHGNTFGTIQEIVTFRNADDREVCGLFILEHEMVNRPTPRFPIARHWCEVRTEDPGLLHFITVNEVRSPVVKVPLLGDLFFIPVPNLFEID